MSDHEIERLSALIHALYQAEAKRQGDVRHADDYAGLSESTKEFDRVIARFVLAQCDEAVREALAGIEARLPRERERRSAASGRESSAGEAAGRAAGFDQCLGEVRALLRSAEPRRDREE